MRFYGLRLPITSLSATYGLSCRKRHPRSVLFLTELDLTRHCRQHPADVEPDLEVAVAAYQSVFTARSRSRRLTIRSITMPAGSL